jgi:hypothetical protein
MRSVAEPAVHYFSGVMRHVPSILSTIVVLFLTGCVYTLRPYNTPSQQKIRVQVSVPTNCSVRVTDSQDFPLAADGRVIFNVPRLPRGDAVYLFGAVKIRDGKPEDVPAIHLMQDGKIVRNFSLTQLDKLPVDADGYHIVVLK